MLCILNSAPATPFNPAARSPLKRLAWHFFYLWQTPMLSRFFCSIAVLGLLLAAPRSFADDWPQYRGPSGDGTVATGKTAEKTAIGDQDSTFQTKWKVPTPNGFSSFAVAKGQCFTLIDPIAGSGTQQPTLVALDAETGATNWSAALVPTSFARGGDAGAAGNKGGDGPRSTPACNDGMVYVYDAGMRLYCFDANSGSAVWQQDIAADFQGRKIIWASAASPVIVDDKVIVCGGGEGQSFLAFDKKTGELRWQTGDEKPTHATPTVATLGGREQVIFFMQSGPVAINPDDGSELWRTKFEFRVSTAASPVVDADRVYLSAGYGVGALVLEVDSEGQASDVWQTKDLWYQKGKLMNHWSTPVVHDGHLYGMYGVKQYGSAPLQCVDLSTGKIQWKQRGYGQGNCILVDDQLIALSDSGELAIVQATPEAYNEIVRVKVLEGKCWSMPAYSDGHVYVRSTTEAACIKL